MKHSAFLLPMLMSCHVTQAQVGNYSLNASTAMRLLDDGSGGSLLAIERRFGYDSAYVELLHADAGWNSTSITAYRFVPHLYYLFDAAKLSSGPLISGLLPNASQSSLLHLNNDGSLAWSVTIGGMDGYQRRFPKVFASGDDFVAYSNTDGFFSDLFYRLEGDATGTTWSAQEISTNDDVPSRFYNGVATGTIGEHVLVGSRRNNTDAQALLARVNGSGVQWMKQYQLDSPDIEDEEAMDVVDLGNDEYACVMKMNDGNGTFATLVMRFDGTGSPIWTTKLTDPGGLYGFALTNLNDGGLLVSATTGSTLRLMRLSATGSLLWAKSCTTCFGGITSFRRLDSGKLLGVSAARLYEFTEDGTACDLDAITTVTAVPFAPVVTSLLATMTAATLTATQVPVLDRLPVNALSTTCVLSGVSEIPGSQMNTAWPTPTSGDVRIDGAHDGDLYSVRAVDGRTVLHGSYRDGINLGGLTAGSYIIDLPSRGLRARVLRQ